jgi:hypothetical protein
VKPIVLTEDQLPTDVDAALVHWSLGLLLRGQRSLREARQTEHKAWGGARYGYEQQADRRAR